MLLKSKNKKWLALAAVVFLIAGALVWYRYQVPRFRVGDTVADFTATLADGSTARLSDLRGKFVLLHFWGSWCGPCRRENPEIVELYKKYNGRGFEVFSVGVEQNRDRWLRAIERDSLAWRFHTADFQEFNGPIAQQFGVWQIPSTWLISREGKIVGVNLPPSHLDRLLAERL